MNVDADDIGQSACFAEYVDWRVDHPSDDLMTDLLRAEFEDETGVTRRLTRDEVLTRFLEWDVDSDGAKRAPTSTVRGWERLPVVVAYRPRGRRPIVRRRIADRLLCRRRDRRRDAAVRSARVRPPPLQLPERGPG